MEQNNQLQVLDLKKIKVGKNNPRKTFDDNSLKELSESIKSKGVLQPILVRPYGKAFELVCGERRYKASVLAGIVSIPANIRNLTDDEAFEAQIVENLERKDVHPLEEVEAFRRMLDSKKYTIADIAAKMVKPEAFIAGRLKLVDLIEPIKVDFVKGYLGIGHATLIAKCDSEKQQGIYSDAKPWREGDESNYGTYQDLKEGIRDDALDLTDAAFSLTECNLYKGGIGACSVCPKRSTANPVLFSEFQDEDICFDEKCFDEKTEVFTQKELARIINESEDVVIIGSNKPSDFVMDMCKQFDVKILKSYDDYRNYHVNSWPEKRAFNVSGRDVGKYETVWIKNENGSKTTVGDNDVQDQISKIETRAKRALELDDEKVWNAVRSGGDGAIGITIEMNSFLNNDKPLTDHERMALLLAIKGSSYHIEIPWIKNIELETVADGGHIPDSVLNEAFRKFINAQLNNSYGSHTNVVGNTALFHSLKDHFSNAIDSICDHFQIKADKRISRTEQKLVELKTKQ